MHLTKEELPRRKQDSTPPKKPLFPQSLSLSLSFNHYCEKNYNFSILEVFFSLSWNKKTTKPMIMTHKYVKQKWNIN